MDNSVSQLSDEFLLSKIFIFRGKKVMLDKDLADLYEVKAIRLREQVKRNIERFPDGFMFQLSEFEAESLVSQNAIPSMKYFGGSLPLVFTEHGVLMLANIIKSNSAIKMSIRIIDIFIRMREVLSNQLEILKKLELLEKKDFEQDEKLLLIFNYIKQLEEAKQQEIEIVTRKRIGFKADI